MSQKTKILSNFSIRKLLYNKKFTVPFSILMAFVFWLVIMISQNPVIETTFTDLPINIVLDNTVAGENGMDVIGDMGNQKFSVKISGPSYIVSSLKTSDLNVYASAAEVTAPGDYNLEVVAAKNSNKTGYNIINISPAVITVTFDYIDTKEFTITPKLVGVGASDGLVAENPIVSGADSDTVTVTGPRTVMNKIKSVVAYAEVNKTLSASQTYESSIKLLDANGSEIDTTNLTLSTSTTKVTQPISKKVEVSVKATFNNLPDGLSESDVKYTVNHQTVRIIGTPDVVSDMTELSLSAIDFTKVSPSSNSFEVTPSLPDGVKIIDSVDSFTVDIDTSGFISKVFTISDLQYTGLSSGLTANLENSIKNVKICGPKSVVNKIKSGELYAEVNLKDKSNGEHTVDAIIKSDIYKDIWQVGSYTATVTIN